MRRAFPGWVAALAGAVCAPAADWSALRPQGYVNDFARVIDAGSRGQLESYAAAVEQSARARLLFVTIPSVGDDGVERVAETLHRNWNAGAAGVVLLLSVEDRRAWLHAGSGLRDALPGEFAAAVLGEMAPALRQSHHGEAFIAAAGTIGARIAEAKKTAITPAPARRIQPEAPDRAPWPLLGGAGVALAILASRRGGRSFLRRLLTGGPAAARRTRFRTSSGGFGAYDSAPECGGFGGCDRGRRKASADW